MPLQQALLEEADRSITILSEGREQQTTVGKVVIRKLLQIAAGGSPHALGHSVRAIIAAQQLRQNEIKEDVEFARRFKVYQQKLLDETLGHGGDPETVLPHPDDILIVEGEGYRIVGPVDAGELKIVQDNCLLRNVLILQAVLEERMADERSEHPSDLFPDAAPLLLVHFMNRGLPERYRMSDMTTIMVMERYRCFTKRDLLKHVRKAWASLGQSRPRGWTMPPLGETRDRIERFVPACINLFGEIKAGKLSNEREIAERIGAIARR